MGEESDLRRQLRRLAVPQTSLLLQDKVRPSLLFDPKEASSLDRDTVFAYGCNGLDKLVSINVKFAKFESSLFSQSVLTFERSVQSELANKNLDEWIKEFLTMLSPYFLLRCSHEALEWLVFRFRIYMFNIDSLISCILPHYHTRIFVRVLQLIDLSDQTSRWHWLQPTKKSGKPLELSTLLKEFNSNAGFRKFVCNLVLETINIYQSSTDVCNTVISFSTVTVYYATKLNKNINENTVNLLLPFLINGLKSQVASYCAGVYAILGLLMVKVKFQTNLLEELLGKICENLIPALTKEAFLLIVTIYQHQNIKKIPKTILCMMLNTEESISLIKGLNHEFHCDKFIIGLLKKCIPASFKEVLSKLTISGKKLSYLYALLNDVCSEENASLYLSIIFKKYEKFYQTSNEATKNNLQEAGKLLLKCLEQRWPRIFDDSIETFFKKNSIRDYKHTLDLVNLSVNSPRHQILPSHGLTLFLGLNHANSVIRLHSINSLISQIKEDEISDVEFVSNTLIQGITDDNADIALAVLKEEEILFKFIPKEQLFNALKGVSAIRKKSSKRRKIMLQVITLSCSQQYRKQENDVLYLDLLEILIPFLFPTSVENVEYLHCIVKSDLADSVFYIDSLKTMILDMPAVNDYSGLISLNEKVLTTFLESISNKNEDLIYVLICHFTKNVDISHSDLVVCVFALLLLNKVKIQSSEKQYDYFNCVFKFLHSLISSDKILIDNLSGGIEGNEIIMDKCLKGLLKFKIPLTVVCLGFNKMLENIKLNLKFAANDWWPDMESDATSERSQQFSNLLEWFTYFVEQSNQINLRKCDMRPAFKVLLNNFIKGILVPFDSFLWFLSFLWSNNFENPSKLLVQVSSLKIATVLSKDMFDGKLCCTLLEDPKYFSSLLGALYSPLDDVRIAALGYLNTCITYCTTHNVVVPFQALSQEICCHSEEIKNDRHQLVQLFDIWFSPVYESCIGQNNTSPATVNFEILKSLAFDKNTPCHIRKTLLMLFQKADVQTFINDFLDLLEYYIDKLTVPVCKNLHLDILQLLISKYTEKSTSSLVENSRFLKSYLSMFYDAITNSTVNKIKILQMALKTLTKTFFFSISSAVVQQKMMDVLIDLYINIKESETHSVVGKILKKICVSAYLLLKDLPAGKTVEKNTSLREVKKSRVQSDSTLLTDVLLEGPWKKITVILEIVQNKKHLNDKDQLIPDLFRLLNLSLNWDNQPSAEYLRQLILASIFNCCKLMELQEINEHKFQIELVIQCIRTSDNPKTHHQALQLLNLAATLFPDHVLRNVMSIFTFMGKNLIRQDDSYSFQIISKTIETIVPALLEASKHQEIVDVSNKDDQHLKLTKTVQVIASIIRKFVNSLPDIPRHRQLPLFTKLITTLESSDYLWVPIAQICERYAYPSKFCQIYKKQKQIRDKDLDIEPTLEFAMNFHQQFPLAVQLETCLHLINYIKELPMDIEKGSFLGNTTIMQDEFKEQMEPLDLTNCTSEVLHDYKQNVLCYVNIWLSSHVFINQVAELDSRALHRLEPLYLALHESTLTFMQVVNGILPTNPKYKTILILLNDLLTNINSQLPCSIFIDVIKSLLTCTISTVQQNALEILNCKLRREPKFFVKLENHKHLLKLMKKLLNIVEFGFTIPENRASSKAALISIQLICELIGKDYPRKFYKVLHVVSSVFDLENQQSSLLISALLCFAELCSCLNALMLPKLKSFMPNLMLIMQDMNLLENNNVVFALLKAVNSLIKNLGTFLSSHMEPLLNNICILISKFKTNCKKELQDMLDATIVLISKEIESRVLISFVQKSYEKLLNGNYPAIGPLVSILGKKISVTSHIQLEDFSAHLESFYLEALNFRSVCTDKPSDLVESLEKEIIDSVLIFVLKLSEPTFCTFFNRIYAWGNPSELEGEIVHSNVKALTFYRLTFELSKTLKSLFVPFIKKFMRHAASVMDANNCSKQSITYFDTENDSVCILTYVIDTLFLSFKYDNNQLGEKELFDVLMQPLVDQIENELGGNEAYQERIENHVTCCVAHFIVLFSDSSLWKALNYQVLLKTRHSSAKVRFAALQVIREIVKKMGDNYLVLLPESIPFLAEIMEDESFEVEQECQDVIENMEKILGEPIKKYF